MPETGDRFGSLSGEVVKTGAQAPQPLFAAGGVSDRSYQSLTPLTLPVQPGM